MAAAFLQDSAYEPDQTRRRERVLLLIAGVFVALNHITLLLVRAQAWHTLWPLAVWIICAIAAHLTLNYTLPARDPVIMPLVLFMAGWGLTLVDRLAPAFGTRQVIWLIIGLTACLLITLLPPRLRILRRFRYTWLLLGLVVLATTLVFGVNPSGNIYAPRLWLGFGKVYFQPSEILKLLLVVFLASYLAEKSDIITTTGPRVGRWQIPALPYLAPMLLMWGFCMILLVWQRDLGAASLFFMIFLCMLYVATGQAGYLVVGIGMLILAGVAGYLQFDLVRLRVDAWINPWPDADNRAFQIVQSLLAVAAGGVLGEGVGLGSPTYIPVVHSDFVFSAIAEEWGLAGALGIVACIALLVVRSFRIAIMHETRRFHVLLASGIGVALGVQSLLIMAGVLKLAPLTGVTLPFVSYGGSSMLSSFIMVGLLLRLSDPVTRFPVRQPETLAPHTMEFSP